MIPRRTIGVDFDGVCHTYSLGWNGGEIYGELVPGTAHALRMLMGTFTMFIHTARSDLAAVATWLEAKIGIPCVADDPAPRREFWDITDVILVSRNKYPAVAYVDDRGVRFVGWEQALADIYAYTLTPCPTGRAEAVDQDPAKVLQEIATLAGVDDDNEVADPRAALIAVRDRLRNAKICEGGGWRPVRSPRSADDLEVK